MKTEHNAPRLSSMQGQDSRIALIDDFDMYSMLVLWQTGGTAPRSMIGAAARATARGEGGEHTREVAALSLQIGKDTVEAIDAQLPGLLRECGAEPLVDVAATRRTFLRLCQRIVDGEIPPPAGAGVISRLSCLPSATRLPWETIRPFFAAAEDLHPDEDPSVELTRRVERVIVAEATQALRATDSV
jgi:hypothetical protein